MANQILIIEDDETLADNVCVYLHRNGWEGEYRLSAEEGLRRLAQTRPDVVLADMHLPGMNGIELVKAINAIDQDIKVVFMSGSSNVSTAVEAMKLGALDYLTKPVMLAELKLVLEKAVGNARLERHLSFYRRSQAESAGLDRLVGESAAMNKVKMRIQQILEAEARLADKDLPAVLITGETGTGKELVARALHFDGSRAAAPFVEVNCAALPTHLLEAELFGHERGAFTDAKERKIGLVESAEGGTLFLDEIGETDLSLQAKLLKLLEDRTVRRIGSTRERKLNVRIISATNQDLDKLVREGRFRADLYFRLRIIEVKMPPLRERGVDVIALARHFLDTLGNRYAKRGLRFSPDAERVLVAYHWPGNVRELRNMLEQTVLLAVETMVVPEQLAMCPSVLSELESAAPACVNRCGGHKSGPRFGPVEADDDRDMLVHTLLRTDWNVSKTAKLLGMSRDMLRYRIEKYGLERPAEPSAY